MGNSKIQAFVLRDEDEEIDLDFIYGSLLVSIGKKYGLETKEYSLMRDGARLAIDVIKFELVDCIDTEIDFKN